MLQVHDEDLLLLRLRETAKPVRLFLQFRSTLRGPSSVTALRHLSGDCLLLP